MMGFLRHTTDGDVVELELAGPRGNALTLAGLEEIERAFDGLAAEGRPGVLLRAGGRSFCTGLDLEVALGLDRPRMETLMWAFHRALSACFAYPGPVVAAVGGHCLAGGALLALACDRRLMARGPARFGIHGARWGIAYPDVAVEICRHQLARVRRDDVLFGARQFDDRRALRRGLVDRLTDPERLLEEARSDLERMTVGSVEAFSAVKARMRSPAIARLTSAGDDGMRRWLDRWFDRETRRSLDEFKRRSVSERAAPPGMGCGIEGEDHDRT